MASYTSVGNLHGTVFDAYMRPLSDVVVTVDLSQAGNSIVEGSDATTDSNGTWSLGIQSTNASDPVGYLSFTKAGYSVSDPTPPVEFSFENLPSVSTPINVTMTADTSVTVASVTSPTDTLRAGADWLANKRTAFMSHAVTYSRGGDSVSLSTTVGKTEFEQTDEYGVMMRIEARDFLMLASDLILGGTETEPRSGDRITETDAASGKTFVYEVLSLPGQPPFRYSGAGHNTLRVHTKLVESDTP